MIGNKRRGGHANYGGNGPRVMHVLTTTAFAGTERHVLGLVRELRKLGCDAFLVCPRSATDLMREARHEDVPTYSLMSSVCLRPSVVHVHDGRSAMLGWLLASMIGVTLVRSQHFVHPASAVRDSLNGTISRAIHRVINRRVDGYVAVSQAAMAAALARGDLAHAKAAVIASGIRLPTQNLVERARVERKRLAAPVVASAGRLERERRFDVLLRAIPEVHERQPECRFVIAGAGSAEGELKALAEELSVDHAIEWTGWLPCIDPMLMRSNVYVNTWPWEGFGMAMAEAMTFELPVIAVRSGASMEVVEDRVTGLLVPPGKPSSLAAAILELLEDRSRSAGMGERGRLRAEGSYSIQRTAGCIHSFYGQLVGANEDH